jgi:hypothetical protein
MIVGDVPSGGRNGESWSGHGAADWVWIWIAVGVKEGVASGWQRVRRVTRKSLCADLVETTDKDVGTNDGDRTVNGGRADGSGASGVTCKEEEPTRKIARTDWGYVGTERWAGLDGMGREKG